MRNMLTALLVVLSIAAVASAGPIESGNADLIYDRLTGQVILDAAGDSEEKILSFVLINDGSADFNTAETNFPFIVTSTNTDNTTSQIGQSDVLEVGFTGAHDLGQVFPTGFADASALYKYLEEATYASSVGGGEREFDLQVVPEPATMGVLAIGGLGVLLRRRRR